MQILEVNYPVLDDKKHIANIKVEKQRISDSVIFLSGRSKIQFLVIENNSDYVENVTFDNKTIEISTGLSVINVTGIETVEFGRIFDGYIYSIGEYDNANS